MKIYYHYHTNLLFYVTTFHVISKNVFATIQSNSPFKEIPGRPQKSYVDLGDLNIGAFFSVSEYSATSLCGDRIRFPLLQQYVEALVFAIKQVNVDQKLLPNVTLGFAMLDDCSKESTAVSQGLRFLAGEKYTKETQISNFENFLPFSNHSQSMQDSPRSSTINSSIFKNRSTEIIHSSLIPSKNYTESYDVIGVIGPLKSSNSIAVSYLLGPAQIPQLSFLATSDELSQKAKHPYFLRVVPPDGYQMRAIVEFILRHGWTYFSVLYSGGSYGELAYGNILQYATSFNLCIATSHKLYSTLTNAHYNDIVQDLLNHQRARVVVLVSGDIEMRNVFESVYLMKASRKFIWIGTDGWAERLSTLPPKYQSALYGSFTTTFYAPIVPEFNKYFQSIKPSLSKNPWFHEFWERQFGCSFEDSSCDEGLDITSSQGFEFLSLSSYAIDSVYVYSYAIHNLLSDRCPGATGKDARKCVSGDILFQYLKNVSFVGYTGFIQFDELGNLLGKYVIKQIRPGQPLTQIPVKVVDVMKSYNIRYINQINWGYFDTNSNWFGPDARFPKTLYKVLDTPAPVSACSRLCNPGEQIVFMEQVCCWECRNCRDNERLTINLTQCLKCPTFYWPDPVTNFTTCYAIEPTYPEINSVYVIGLMFAGFLGVGITILVIYGYSYHRKARVIKASSRELSFLQLFAVFIGYVTMFVYIVRPSHISCVAGYYMFCFSFNCLYVPLLVKAIRIFRIFNSGRKGTRVITGVSPTAQILFSAILISGQVVLCIAVAIVDSPTAKLHHKIRTEKYVELACDLTEVGFATFLSYNIFLVFLCSLFAFKTRRLPANFNESRFISMCVSTTLVIWLAFIPAYNTATLEYLKTLYLALALILNHTIAIVFLFLTRLYAVYYVDDVDIDSRVMPVSNVTSMNRSRNIVEPVSSVPIVRLTDSHNHLLPPPTATPSCSSSSNSDENKNVNKETEKGEKISATRTITDEKDIKKNNMSLGLDHSNNIFIVEPKYTDVNNDFMNFHDCVDNSKKYSIVQEQMKLANSLMTDNKQEESERKSKTTMHDDGDERKTFDHNIVEDTHSVDSKIKQLTNQTIHKEDTFSTTAVKDFDLEESKCIENDKSNAYDTNVLTLKEIDTGSTEGPRDNNSGVLANSENNRGGNEMSFVGEDHFSKKSIETAHDSETLPYPAIN